MTWAYRREERTTGLGAFGRTSFGGWPRRKPRDQFQCPKCRGYTWVFVFWVVPQVRFLNFPFHAIHSIALKFTIDKHTESMECFRMLSRTNLADPSRRSSLNPRPVNLLQPLFYPEPRRVRSQKSQVLYNQANPASFCKTPGWGVPSQISPLESATSISLFLALSAGCEGFPLQLQLLQLRIRRRMRILSDDQESTESHSPFSPLATCPSPLSCSELLRCTEAQKRLFVSPLFAALTHSVSRKSFPCHSYANTRDEVPNASPQSFASAVTCVTWRLYPLCPQSIAYTSCHHGGVGPAPALLATRHSVTRHFPPVLCFHTLTNPFSHNPFRFTSIQIPRGCTSPTSKPAISRLALEQNRRNSSNWRGKMGKDLIVQPGCTKPRNYRRRGLKGRSNGI